MDTFHEIASILHPLPRPDDLPEEVYDDVRADIERDRADTAAHLELGASEADDPDQGDPLLNALRRERHLLEETQERIRRLLAYGREFTGSRPYKLAVLAEVSGMSTSGVRTAYDERHVTEVARALGRGSEEPRP